MALRATPRTLIRFALIAGAVLIVVRVSVRSFVEAARGARPQPSLRAPR